MLGAGTASEYTCSDAVLPIMVFAGFTSRRRMALVLPRSCRPRTVLNAEEYEGVREWMTMSV